MKKLGKAFAILASLSFILGTLLSSCSSDGGETHSSSVAVKTITIGNNSSDDNPSTVTPSIEIGGTITLTATVSPENASNKKLTWAAEPEGSVEITPSEDTLSAEIKITENAVAGDEVTITVTAQDGSKVYATATIAVVEQVEFTKDSESVSTESLGGEAENASSSDDSVATVTVENGAVEITSKKAGTATITVTKSGYYAATIAVTVSASGEITASVTNKFEEIPADAVISSIKVTPEAVEVNKGTSADDLKSKLTVTAVYSDKNENPVTDYTVSDYAPSTIGEQTVTISYNGNSKTVKVTVVDPFAEDSKSVSAESLGAEAESASSSDESVATVAVENGAVVITSKNAGTATITVSKSGYYAATIAVTVSESGEITTEVTTAFVELPADIALTSIESNFSSIGVFVGATEAALREKLTVTAYYSNATSSPLTDYTVSGFDTSAAGEKTVTLSYTYKEVTKTAVVNVTVKAVALTSITTSTSAVAVAYAASEADLKEKLTVTAVYNNGTEETVTDYTVSGFDSTKAGDQTVTLTYNENKTTVTVTVSEPTPTSITAEISHAEVARGTTEDALKELITVTASYKETETTETVTDYTISGYTPTKLGEQTVKVSYKKNGVTKTADVAVTVKLVVTGTLAVTDKVAYVLSKENLESTAEADAWNAVSTSDFSSSKKGTAVFTDEISAYNMSKDERYFLMNVSGVVSADLYVVSDSNTSRTLKVTIGDGETQELTRTSLESGAQLYSFTTGTTEAVTIKISGNSGSVYPVGIIFYPTEVTGSDFTVDVPSSTSDITLSVSEADSKTLTVSGGDAEAEGATFAWYVDNALVSGATSSSYTLAGLFSGKTYEVRVVVTANGHTYSQSTYVLYQ